MDPFWPSLGQGVKEIYLQPIQFSSLLHLKALMAAGSTPMSPHLTWGQSTPTQQPERVFIRLCHLQWSPDSTPCLLLLFFQLLFPPMILSAFLPMLFSPGAHKVDPGLHSSLTLLFCILGIREHVDTNGCRGVCPHPLALQVSAHGRADKTLEQGERERLGISPSFSLPWGSISSHFEAIGNL